MEIFFNYLEIVKRPKKFKYNIEKLIFLSLLHGKSLPLDKIINYFWTTLYAFNTYLKLF